MITAHQIKLIHIAAKQVGLDDAGYRLVLRSSGKAESSKDLTQAGFEDCMATLEEMGYRDPRHAGGAGDYWRNKVAQRGRFANARQVQMIERLAGQQRYCLPALCERFSSGRVAVPDRLTPREAWNLIEMLKAAVSREPLTPGEHTGGDVPASRNPQRATSNSQPATLFPHGGSPHETQTDLSAIPRVILSDEDRRRRAEADELADAIDVPF